MKKEMVKYRIKKKNREELIVNKYKNKINKSCLDCKSIQCHRGCDAPDSLLDVLLEAAEDVQRYINVHLNVVREIKINASHKLGIPDDIVECTILSDEEGMIYANFITACMEHMLSTAEMIAEINFKYLEYHWNIKIEYDIKMSMSGYIYITLLSVSRCIESRVSYHAVDGQIPIYEDWTLMKISEDDNENRT